MNFLRRVRPEINVTPLVDVVLVLLIIFMVVTPMMESGLAMDFPKASHPEEDPRGMDPVLVSVGPAGEVFLDSRPVRREDLPHLLAQIRRVDPSRPVVLQADRNLAFRQVREVFRLCEDAGMDGLSLRVSPPEQER